MATKNDILIDVDDTTSWLKKRNLEIESGKLDVSEKDMPVLARVICGGEKEISKLKDEDRKKYEKHFKDNKKTIAMLTLAGTGVVSGSIGAIASGIGTATTIASFGTGIGGAAFSIAAGSGLSIAGMGTMAAVPALWPIGISMLAVSAGSLFKKAKQKNDEKKRTEELEMIFNESHNNAQKCSQKMESNNKIIKDILSQKLKETIQSLYDSSKKIKIKIDDALNKDQNLRIMQYQEIVLNQYNSQNEIRKMLSELIEAYNKLVIENEELSKKIAAYEATMKMCGCANNYIS